jgi:hypothetical protein
MTDHVEEQCGRQQQTPIDAIRQECEQWRFDAKHGGAVSNQRSSLRNIDRERTADFIDEAGGSEHAGTDHEIAEQQRPARPDLSIIHAEQSASL